MATRTVPVGTKLLYGLGDAAIQLKNISLNRFLLFFYTDVVHLAPALVGAIIFVGRAWDAVTDPAIGYLSDTTRGRWGRRRPYVLLSAVPMGVCYYALFSPPHLSAGAMLWYLLLVNLALFTAFTVFAVPYLAWGAELTSDYHERTEVVQIRALFGVLGGVLGAALPVLIASRYADPFHGYRAMAAWLGAAIALAGVVTAVSVRDRRGTRVPAASVRHFLGGLAHTFANRDFRIIFATFFLMMVATALGDSIQIHVVKYWLQMYDFFPVIVLTFALSYAGSFPFWLGLSRRVGKRRALLVGLAAGCLSPFGWLVVAPGAYWLMLGFSMVAGSVAGSVTLAMSQAIDIIDLDELQTGEQRAGAYFGIWAFGIKAAGAFGTLLGGALLEAVGYTPETAQDSNTLWWLIMSLGPLQSGVFLIAFVVFRRTHFEAADVARIQAALHARRSTPA